MSGKRDIAWVADQIVDTLTTDLPAMLDTLEAEYADGLELPDIPGAHIFMAEKLRLPSVPFVFVIPDRTETQPFSGESRYGIEFHQLTIAVVDGGNITPDLMKRRCIRYVRAAQEVLLADRTLDGTVEDVLVMGKDYAPLMQVESGLIQEGQVTVRVQTLT